MGHSQHIKPGAQFETRFYANPKKDSPFRFRATHLDGERSPKVVLSNDARIQPGKLCRVRISKVMKPSAKNRGHIEVEWLCQVNFKLDDSVYVDKALERKLQALLESGRNILLDGPQGSGKTFLTSKIAEALDFEYIYFNCSAVYEASDFVATLQLQSNEQGQTETVWIPSDILRALTEANENRSRRFLVFLDELNRCREVARNGLMPALDVTRKLYNPMNGEFMNVPDNVLWVAAINNGAQFTGTTTIDPAQLDRFAPLKIGYPPADAEIRLLSKRHPDVPRQMIEKTVKAANAVRADEQLAVDLSMRATDEVCMLLGHPNYAVYDGDPLPEILQTSFCARFLGNWDNPATDAGLVWKVIQRAIT